MNDARFYLAAATRRRAWLPLVIGSAAVIGLGALVDTVREDEATVFDERILSMVHSHDGPALDSTMRALSTLASPTGVAVCVLALGAFFWRRRQRFDAALLVGTTALAGLLNVLLKLIFQRGRPELFFEVEAPKSFSFPSGHAMGALVAFGMSAVLLGRAYRRARFVIWAAATVLTLAVGVSRIFLGVHWPTDVAGGFLTGGLLLVAGASAHRRLPLEQERRDG